MKNLLVIFVIGILFTSCDTKKKAIITAEPQIVEKTENETRTPKAKNIILMIGDGMGITQISAGMYSNDNYLNLERFKTIGLHKCYSSDALVTDSAAGATAFSTGVKTYNGAIGVDPDTIPVQTILEVRLQQ